MMPISATIFCANAYSILTISSINKVINTTPNPKNDTIELENEAPRTSIYRKRPTPTALIRMKKTIPYLYLHLSRRIPPANIHILSPTTIKTSITRPTSRNFHPIYSADNSIGVSLLTGQC